MEFVKKITVIDALNSRFLLNHTESNTLNENIQGF